MATKKKATKKKATKKKATKRKPTKKKATKKKSAKKKATKKKATKRKPTKKKATKKGNPKKGNPKKGNPKKKAVHAAHRRTVGDAGAPASLFEVYYTVLIPFSEKPTKWHPPDKAFGDRAAGAFEKRSEAVAWAKDKLGGQPYKITTHTDVARPKPAYYRTVDVAALTRMIELGGDGMKKAARAEKRRRKPQSDGAVGDKKPTSLRERELAKWLRGGRLTY